MDENELIKIGKRLQEEARHEVSLQQFMLKEADPKVWAKVHQETSDKHLRVVEMNKLRSKTGRN